MKNKGQNGIFRRMLISYLLLSTLLTVALSYAMHNVFESVLIREIQKPVQKNLAMLRQNVSHMVDTASKLSTQLYLNADFSYYIYSGQMDSDAYLRLTEHLRSVHTAMPYLDSVYVYSGKNGGFFPSVYSDVSSNPYILSEEQFPDKSALAIIRDYSNYYSFSPIYRTIVLNDTKTKPMAREVYSIILRDEVAKKEKPDYAIMVNLSRKWLENLIREKELESGSFILNTKGDMVYGSELSSRFYNTLPEEEKLRLLAPPSDTGMTALYDAGEYLVSHTSPDPYGWIYVNFLSLNTAYSEINTIRTRTLLVSGLLLLIGFFLSYFLAVRQYRPIHSILAKLRLYEQDALSDKRLKNQLFMRSLLEEGALTSEKANEELRNRGIPYRFDCTFFPVLVRVDKYREFCREFSPQDRSLFKYAVGNIMEELCGELFSGIAVDMEDDLLALILNAGSKEDYDRKAPELEAVLRRVQASVSQHLDLSVSCVAGLCCEDLRQLPYTLRLAFEHSFHRLFFGRQCVLFSKTIRNYSRDSSELRQQYPAQKEKLFLEALRQGNAEEAQKHYNEIITALSTMPRAVIKMEFLRLVSKINETVDIILSANGTLRDEIHHVLIDLDEYELIEEVNHAIAQSLQNIAGAVNNRRGVRHEHLSERVMSFVRKHLEDPNLSVELVASHLNLSSYYAGKLFKAETGQSIQEHISEARMSEAEQLLLKGCFSVSDIAQRIGFTNTVSFHRAFKKKTGMTPKEYERSKKETAEKTL